MCLILDISTQQQHAKHLFSEKPEADFVTRMLADGMDDHCVLERLFEDQLLSHHFPEANNIVWNAEYTDFKDGENITLSLIMPHQKPV